MNKIIRTGFIAGLVLFTICYGSLYLAVHFFPMLFVEYNNPLFNSDGSRDLLFYLHAFIISFALAWFWERFKGLFHGPFLLRGLEFGLVYALVALVPVMWITFSALDITGYMVGSWLAYGTVQAIFAGVIFARINP